MKNYISSLSLSIMKNRNVITLGEKVDNNPFLGTHPTVVKTCPRIMNFLGTLEYILHPGMQHVLAVWLKGLNCTCNRRGRATYKIESRAYPCSVVLGPLPHRNPRPFLSVSPTTSMISQTKESPFSQEHSCRL